MIRPLIRPIITITAVLTASITVPYALAADNVIETRAAIDHGDFARAATLGQALGTADGMVLAAEALAAPVLLGMGKNPKKAAKAAYKLAEAAIALEPNNIEAHMQAALSLGFVTRASSPISVWRKGLAIDLKDAINAFETLAPNDARAHALRGAWHYGIVRKAGEKRAQKWYEANLDSGNAAYETALRIASQDIIITANYALSLVDVEYETNQSRAKVMLEDCTFTPAKTATEQAVQNRMRIILARWDEQDFVEDEAERWLDGE